jgi:hypothetical protein
MTDFPDVKLKALVSFPATIIDGAGIDVTRLNGSFKFDLAYDDFAPPLTTVADPANSVMLIWNTISGQYGLAPTSLLLGSGSVFPSTATPIMDGTGAAGASALYARGDHVHPTDSSRAPLASPVFTGDPRAPTPPPGDSDTSIATTAFVSAAVIAGGVVSPAALTRTNDTNVTLTLGGIPSTALLQAASITAGWTGTLAQGRGGFGADISAVNGVPVFTTGTAAFTAIATAAEYAANAAPAKIMTPGASWTAANLVTLTDGATVTPNFASGFDFDWTIGAVGRTLANPTNAKVGQKGMIYLTQGIAGATITTWDSAYKFPNGVKPTLSTASGAVDVISYAVRSSVQIECFFAAGMA